MKSYKTAIVLSALNAVLLAALVAQHAVRPAVAQEAAAGADAAAAAVPEVLRARSLEIVDEQGRVRALLAVMPAATVEGKPYPETVLLRLIDPVNGPVVKLTAAINGSALGLSDDAEGGVQLFGRDTGSFVRVTGKDGATRTLEP
jgi:hypothetical protein